jgi:Zn-dependent peptidase ImmA (M78 family)
MRSNLFIYIVIAWTSICLIGLIYQYVKEAAGVVPKKLNTPYTTLIEEVVKWSGSILRQASIKYYPHYEVSYYKSKTKLGCYFSSQKKIVIYPKSHSSEEAEKIKTIVHTTLHEICHYMQHMKNKDFKYYSIYSKKRGYQKNPFEIEANEFATKNLNECLAHLIQKRVLV